MLSEPLEAAALRLAVSTDHMANFFECNAFTKRPNLRCRDRASLGLALPPRRNRHPTRPQTARGIPRENNLAAMRKQTRNWRARRAPHGDMTPHDPLRWMIISRCALLFGLFLLLRILAGAQEADLIITGGKLVTVDPQFSVAQAMAIRAGRIMRVGNDAEVLKTKGAATRVLELAGKTVLPGLIDSHVHPGAAMTEFDHPIPEMVSIADVLAYIRERAELLEDGEWIEVRQVFITRLREQRYPTRQELDQAAPNNPVIFSTGPDASLNTLALKLSGIGANFAVTDGGPGYAERDPQTGEPTGILRACTRYVKPRKPARSKKPAATDHLTRLTELFRDYNAVGLTSVADRSADPENIARYQQLRDDERLTVRLFVSAHVPTVGELANIQKQIRTVAAHPLRARTEDAGGAPRLRIIGIKTFLDGGMLTGSAYMREPWGVSAIYNINDPEYRGLLLIPRDRLLPLVRTALENELQFTAHSVGDGAVELLLQVYDELHREMPERFRSARPCITHCNFMSANAVAELARLGAVADIQPIWLHLDGRTLTTHFGEERLRYFQPLKTLFASGAMVGGGSDHMQKIGPLRAVNPYHPFLGMWIAMSRRARGQDAPVHAEEALTREQAIRFYTSNNAHLLLEEKTLGSLETGKAADFIVLDRDILTCDLDEIPKINVVRTFVAGREVFARN